MVRYSVSWKPLRAPQRPEASATEKSSCGISAPPSGFARVKREKARSSMPQSSDMGSHLVHEASPVAASQVLAEQREAIHQRLLAGASGDEVVAANTDVVDGLIIGRYRTAARTGGEVLTT